MSTRSIATILCLLALCVTVWLGNSATQSNHRHTPRFGRDGGTLELTGDDFRSLDPARAYDVASWGFERLIYTGLVDYDNGTQIVPHGAKSWSISADGRTYHFVLRRDVHFEGPITKGRMVTSEDYAYELRRILNPQVASPGLEFYTCIEGANQYHQGKSQSVKGIQTPTPYDLIITLKRRNPVFLNLMALPFAFAVPREVVERYHVPGFEEHAEGSGPFILERWRRLLDITLKRNPHYFEAGLPHLDAIHETFGMDALNSMMLFETGDIDISSIPPPDFVRITHDASMAPDIEHSVQMAVDYISLNCEMPPFNNKSVRQALNYAVDRHRLLKLLNNRGVLATGVLPPGMPGFDPALKGYRYDPERARDLLRKAGYPQGFSSVLWIRSSTGQGEEMRIAQSIQQDLRQVGVKIDIKPESFPSWLDAVTQEKTVPMSINNWYQDYPDPSDFLDVLLSSKQARPQDSNNRAFYKSHQMDDLLQRASDAPTPQERLLLYSDANHLAVNDAPWIFLYYPEAYMIHKPWVHGFKIHPVWPAKYEDVWFSR